MDESKPKIRYSSNDVEFMTLGLNYILILGDFAKCKNGNRLVNRLVTFC